MTMRPIPWLLSWVVLAAARSVAAATLSVGPGSTYPSIMAAWEVVQPGDVIEVYGGQTYLGTFLLDSDHSGTAAKPITLRGIPVGGQRPILKGIGPGKWDNMVVLLNADHFVMEGFEIVGNSNDSDYCLVHKANDVTLRDLVVHDCLHQGGLVGNDDGSGSLTLEYSDFYHNGNGTYSHQIYMATDQAMYPHSIFRMQHCFVHDGLGGNNVKSRAERNEIYYNWVEGAYYHELDLIGPDVGGTSQRCDSDVVGNVFVKTSEWRVARIGGDGSGDSQGRFRFVNNTLVLSDLSKVAIGLQFSVSSLEMYNNLIMAPKAGFKVYDINEPSGPPAVFSGSNNWLVTGMTAIPTPWTNTLTGDHPGFVDLSNHDLRPAPTSPLVGQGTVTTASAGALPFPSPLERPAFFPPARRLLAVGTASARPVTGELSIGAFEPSAPIPGAQSPNVGPGTVDKGAGSGSGSTGRDGSGGGSNAGSSSNSDNSPSGCTCRFSADPVQGMGWGVGAIASLLAIGRRRRGACGSSAQID